MLKAGAIDATALSTFACKAAKALLTKFTLIWCNSQFLRADPLLAVLNVYSCRSHTSPYGCIIAFPEEKVEVIELNY